MPGRTEHDAVVRDAADPLPVVRAAQPDRVHLRRRRDGAAARARRAGERVVRIRLPARQSGGPHDELWLHSAGCRQWFEVRRDTRTHEILASAAAGPIAGRARDDAVAFVCRRRRRRSRAAARRSSSTARATRAIAGDTLASALLANGVHLVGRSFKYHRPRGIFTRRARRAERAGAARRAARAPSPTCARRRSRALRRPRRGEPELLAVARASTSARSTTCCRASFPRASTTRRSCGRRRRVVAALRARDPPRRRHGPRRDGSPIPIATSISTRTATCW